MAQIPKLGSQWRIIYDFKPTEYLQAEDPSRLPASLSAGTGDWKTPGSSFVAIFFPFPKIVLTHGIKDNINSQVQMQRAVKSTQLPKVGEWTRVEIGHEKVDEKYFLSLSLGGREVGRKEVTDPELRKLTDVQVCIGDQKVCIGDQIQEGPQPGFIRRLVVLEKR